MDDPGLAWPSWKFGMKREDLVGTLNDRYNTFSWNIQDQEAFHHDVYEISTGANSVEEFHRLMALRKIQRLRELNESLESAAVEIVANPALIGNDKWDYALQVFRTRSLDSLIRFFASHLPEDYHHHHHHHRDYPHRPHPHPHPHPHHHDDDVFSPASSTYSSFDDGTSIKTTASTASTVDDDDDDDDDSGPSFFDAHDQVDLTDEPLPLKKGKIEQPFGSSPAGSVSDPRESRPASLYDGGASIDTPASSLARVELSFFSGAAGVDGEEVDEDEDDERVVESRGPQTPISSLPGYTSEEQPEEGGGDQEEGGEGEHMYSRGEKRVALPPPRSVNNRQKATATCNDDHDHDHDDDNDAEEEIPTPLAYPQADDAMDADTPTPRQEQRHRPSFPCSSSSSSSSSQQTVVAPSPYLDSKIISSSRRHHPSPTRGHHRRPHCGHREASPLEGIRRGTQEPLNRVQKSCVRRVL